MLYAGIDLGTTNTVVCTVNENGCVPLDFSGDSCLPSVVLVEENGGTVVGRRAKNARRVKADRIITRAKPHMPSGKAWHIDGRAYTPVDSAREILKAAAARLREVYGDQPIKAIVTVPACFSSAACEATRRAAQEAGIECVKLQLEPVAAAIAWGAENENASHVLVVDTGGGTFDLAIVSSTGVSGKPDHLDKVGGLSDLGGNDFDDVILEQFLMPNLTGESNGDAQAQALRQQMLEDAAQQAKEFLQTSDRYVKSAVFRDGTALNVEITQEQYLNVCGELRGRMCIALQELLDSAHPASIDRVILAGGMSNDPNVHMAIRAVLGDVPFETPENFMSMIAAGAAIDLWASQNNGGFENTVTYTHLGIRTEGEDDATPSFEILIPKNTSITPSQPAVSASNRLFSNAADNSTFINIMVYESTGSTHLEHCHLHNTYRYEVAPMPRHSNKIKVTLSLDINRVLTVEARDLANPEREALCVRLNLDSQT